MRNQICKLLIVGILMLSMVGIVQALSAGDTISYWNFNLGSGTLVSDSKSVNNGVMHSAKWGTGKLGLAMYMGNANIAQYNYTKINSSASFVKTSANSFSISMWVKRNTSNITTQQIEYAYRPTGTNYDYILFDTTSHLNLDFLTSTSSHRTITTATTYTKSGWLFVVATMSPTALKLYVNGTYINQDLTAATGYWMNATGQHFLGIAQDGTSSPSGGYIDEVLFYNTELTSGDVTLLYNLGAGLTYPFTNNFTVTAKGRYNSTAITGFNIWFNTTKYSTLTTSKVFNITMNASSPIENIIVGKANYFNVSYPSYKTNVTLAANVTPYTKVMAFSKLVPATSITTFGINLSAKEYNTTSGYVYVPVVNISSLSIFNANIGGTDLYESKTVSVTGTPYLRSYNFSLLHKNSIYIQVKNIENGSLIKGTNVDIGISSGAYNLLATTNNGSYKAELLAPDSYVIQYNATNFGNKFYYITLTDGMATNITLWMSTLEINQVTFQIYDTISQNVQNAIVKLLCHVNGTAAYTLVTMGKTDVNGQVVLPLVLNNRLYQVYVEYGGVLKNVPSITAISSTPVYFTIDTGNVPTSLITNLYGVGSSLSNDYVNKSTSTGFNETYIFSDTLNTISGGCLYIYRTDIYALVNSSCVTGASGLIKLKVYSRTGTYRANGMLTYGGIKYVRSQDFITIAINDSATIQTKSNLFMFAIIVFTLGIMGFFLSPPLGFSMLGFGTLVLAWIGVTTWAVATPIAIVMFLLAVVIGTRLS